MPEIQIICLFILYKFQQSCLYWRLYEIELYKKKYFHMPSSTRGTGVFFRVDMQMTVKQGIALKSNLNIDNLAFVLFFRQQKCITSARVFY